MQHFEAEHHTTRSMKAHAKRWWTGVLLLLAMVWAGCDCGKPTDPPLPPGHVRLSLSLRTPAFQRFSRMRDVTITIAIPGKDALVQTHPRVLLGRSLVVNAVVPGEQTLTVTATGKAWDDNQAWGGKWSFALPTAMSENIGVLTMGKDGKLDRLLPMLFASGSKDSAQVRFWTLAPQGASASPTIEWKGDVDFRGEERKGDPSQDPSKPPALEQPTTATFHIRDADLKEDKAPILRIDYKSEGKDIDWLQLQWPGKSAWSHRSTGNLPIFVRSLNTPKARVFHGEKISFSLDIVNPAKKELTILWKDDCGGVFGPSEATVTWSAPAQSRECAIEATIKDKYDFVTSLQAKIDVIEETKPPTPPKIVGSFAPGPIDVGVEQSYEVIFEDKANLNRVVLLQSCAPNPGAEVQINNIGNDQFKVTVAWTLRDEGRVFPSTCEVNLLAANDTGGTLRIKATAPVRYPKLVKANIGATGGELIAYHPSPFFQALVQRVGQDPANANPNLAIGSLRMHLRVPAGVLSQTQEFRLDASAPNAAEDPKMMAMGQLFPDGFQSTSGSLRFFFFPPSEANIQPGETFAHRVRKAGSAAFVDGPKDFVTQQDLSIEVELNDFSAHAAFAKQAQGEPTPQEPSQESGTNQETNGENGKDAGDAGNTDDTRDAGPGEGQTDQPSSPTDIAKRFQRKGDEGVVFVIPDGDNPNDYTATSTCGEITDIRKETRDGKVVLILTVTQIPRLPDCEITILKNGNPHKTTQIPYGFETDQSDNPNRVRLFVNGLFQDMVVRYVSQHIMPMPLNHHGQARNYAVLTAFNDGDFTRPAFQPIKTNDLKTGTILWTDPRIKEKLLDHTAFFLNGQVNLKVTQVDDTNDTITLDTQGFDLTVLAQHKINAYQFGSVSGETITAHTTFGDNNLTALEVLNANTLKIRVIGTNVKSPSLANIKAGDTARMTFFLRDKQGKEDNLRFGVGDTAIDATLTLHAAALDWKVGVEFPDTNWLSTHFRLVAAIAKAGAPPHKPHAQLFAETLGKKLLTGKDPTAHTSLYPTLKFGPLAAMERWYCVRKLQGKSTDKATPMELLPPGTLLRSDAFSQSFVGSSRLIAAVFFNTGTAERFERLITWGGLYAGNKSFLPLDEPDCSHYATSDALIKINSKSQENLDARSVVDLLLMDKIIDGGYQFPESCRGDSTASNCAFIVKNVKLIKWHEGLQLASGIGLEEAYKSQFAPAQTDEAPFCDMKIHWSTKGATFAAGPECRYIHSAGFGTFDVVRSLASEQFDQWLFTHMAGQTAPFAKHKAWDGNLSCSLTSVNQLKMCPDKSPDARALLEMAQGRYISTQLKPLLVTCRDFQQKQAAIDAKVKQYQDNFPLPTPANPCAPLKDIIRTRDLEHIARHELGHLLPGNALPPTNALIRACYEDKESTIKVNGKIEKCNTYAFKNSCQSSFGSGPAIVADTPDLTCQTPLQYHHELPLHDQRFAVAINECADTFRYYFTYWQLCQFHHMSRGRGRNTKVSDDFQRGYPLDDNVRCEQYDFNQNNRIDMQDAVWLFNLMYQGVLKGQASYVNVYPKIFRRPYPTAMLTELEPKAKAFVDAALTGVLLPATGLEITRFSEKSDVTSIGNKYIVATLPDGSNAPVSSFTRSQLFHSAIQFVIWRYIASLHQTDPNKWLEIMMRMQRTGVSRSIESPRAVAALPSAQSNLVLPMMCAMILTGRGPNDVGPIDSSKGTTQALAQVIDQWATALGASIGTTDPTRPGTFAGPDPGTLAESSYRNPAPAQNLIGSRHVDGNSFGNVQGVLRAKIDNQAADATLQPLFARSLFAPLRHRPILQPRPAKADDPVVASPIELKSRFDDNPLAKDEEVTIQPPTGLTLEIPQVLIATGNQTSAASVTQDGTGYRFTIPKGASQAVIKGLIYKGLDTHPGGAIQLTITTQSRTQQFTHLLLLPRARKSPDRGPAQYRTLSPGIRWHHDGSITMKHQLATLKGFGQQHALWVHYSTQRRIFDQAIHSYLLTAKEERSDTKKALAGGIPTGMGWGHTWDYRLLPFFDGKSVVFLLVTPHGVTPLAPVGGSFDPKANGPFFFVPASITQSAHEDAAWLASLAIKIEATGNAIIEDKEGQIWKFAANGLLASHELYGYGARLDFSYSDTGMVVENKGKQSSGERTGWKLSLDTQASFVAISISAQGLPTVEGPALHFGAGLTLSQIVGDDESSWLFRHSSEGPISQITNPAGGTLRLTFDAQQRLSATSLTPTAKDQLLTSTTQGLIALTGDLTSRFVYGQSQTTYSDPVGRTFTFALDSTGRVSTLKVKAGSGADITLATYGYLTANNQETLLVTSLIDHEANTFSWFYDQVQAKADTTLFLTDKASGGARGLWILLKQVSTPGGTRSITRITSGLDLGLIQSVRNPWGTSTLTYKDRLLIQSDDPDRSVKWTRDTTGSKAVIGQIVAEEDLREKRITCYLYESDPAKGGNGIGEPSGKAIGVPGACPGAPTNNAAFRTYTLEYNASGHVLERFDPFTGGKTTMARLADGRVTSHQGAETWSRRYFGTIIQQSTRMGDTQDITFGGLLAPVTERFSVSGGSRCRQHWLDSAGRTLASIGTTGDISLFAYDALDRVTLRKYPTDIRVTAPCESNTAALLALLQSSKAALTHTIDYPPNARVTTKGNLQTIEAYGWHLDGKRVMFGQTHLETNGSGFAPLSHIENQYDGRGLLLGVAEYGHTNTTTSPLTTRACVPAGVQGFPAARSVSGSQLALFNERYMGRDGQGWITQLCTPDGARIEWPFAPITQEQKTFQGSSNVLNTTVIRDVWGRAISWKRGNLEYLRMVYDKDGGVTGQPQVYQEHRFNTQTGSVFAYQSISMDAQGRIASRKILDATGKTLEDISHTYDTAGRLATQVHKDPSGLERTITKVWSDVGLHRQEVTTTSTQKSGGPSKDQLVQVLKHDAIGRLGERQLQRFGITVEHATWQHHGWGAIASMTLPLRQIIRSFTYDDSGRIATANAFNQADSVIIGALAWQYAFAKVTLDASLLDPATQSPGKAARAMEYTLDYAGRPLLAVGQHQTTQYRYDARGNLRCQSVRVEVGKQVAGGRWDASYDALSRRTSLQVYPFVQGTDVTHCDKSAPSNPTQDLTYEYEGTGYLKTIRGTLGQKPVIRGFAYHANGLLQSETMSADGLSQPARIDYTYLPHGMLEGVALQAALPANDNQPKAISTIKLTYGTGNAWWSQRSQAQMTVHEYHGFLRYNRIGDGRFDIAAHHRAVAQRILGKGFEILEQQLSLPQSQITGTDHRFTVAKVDNIPEVRMDVLRYFDDHGRIQQREQLLYARAKTTQGGFWPFDDNGSVRNFNNLPFQVISNGQFVTRTLQDMFSCKNTLDTYRQGIATGISPKHLHIQAIEDPSVAFRSFADTPEFATVTSAWGLPLRRSCEHVRYDTQGARPIGIHQRLLFFLPQFWVSPQITDPRDRGRLGLYQLMGQKTFAYNQRNQLIKMDVAGMLYEAGGDGPFAPKHEWIDNFANIAGSHKIQYPGQVGNQGNIHFSHHRYWHSPHVLGGMLGWAFPESREDRAPMVVPKAGAASTVEVRGALYSTLYDPAGRLFATFNPPSTVPSPVDFGKVALQLTNRSTTEQQQLATRYQQTYVDSHQHRLHFALLIGNHSAARIDKAWFKDQGNELPCPLQNDTETMRCTLDNTLSSGAGHLRFRTGEVFHPLHFNAGLDDATLNVSVVDANRQPFHGVSVNATGQRFLYLDRDHMGHAALEDWQGMIAFQAQSGQQLLDAQSGMQLADALRPARLSALLTLPTIGTWMSPLAHATPLLSRIQLPTLPPYTIDPHSLQIALEQSIQIWSQVIQNEQNKIQDVLVAAQGELQALSIGLGVATITLPFMAPFLESSIAAMAILRTTIVTLELVQVALVAAEVAAVVQSQGIHQISLMQAVMLASGVLSTVIAAKVGLPPTRLARFQRFVAKAEVANTIIGASMVTALALDGAIHGFNETHAQQAAFFAGASVFSASIGKIQKQLLTTRTLTPDTTRYMTSNGAERLQQLKAKYNKDPEHIVKHREGITTQRLENRQRHLAERQRQHKEHRRFYTDNQVRNALKRNVIRQPLKQGLLKHRVDMQAQVYHFGQELLGFLDAHATQAQGKAFVNQQGQLDLPLLVDFLKQKNPTVHAALTPDAPALQQMFKTVTLEVQKHVTQLGRTNGVDTFAALTAKQQAQAIEQSLVALKEQVNTIITDANHPNGWKKSFDNKNDSLGKDAIKHIISTHAQQPNNKKFFFKGKSAEDFWNACNRRWACVKDAYETKQLNPEEMYLMREFRLKETRKFVNEAGQELGLCNSPKNPKSCAEIVFAPPAGSDGPTSDYDISWTVLKADGTPDLAASAALIGHATRKYIKAIGTNAETAFEHGLFVPPPAFIKELNKLALNLQKSQKQEPDALAFFIRNLDPNGKNTTKAILDMKAELNKFGAPGLSQQIAQGETTFARFTNVASGKVVAKALEDLITCKDTLCTSRDRTVWNGLFVDGNNQLLTNPTINPITLALKKLITDCTNATCTDGPGQSAWKTKFFDESTNKLRPDGEGVIKDMMGSLVSNEMALQLQALQLPPPGATQAQIDAFNTALGEIITLDTHLKFLQPESYGTVSTLVHIVEGIQKGKNIGGLDFRGSFFENMGYERHYQQTGQGDKIQKYGVRVADALKRMIEDDPTLQVLYSQTQRNQLNAILERLNGIHKTNASTKFVESNSLANLQRDMTDIYLLAKPAMQKLFP